MGCLPGVPLPLRFTTVITIPIQTIWLTENTPLAEWSGALHTDSRALWPVNNKPYKERHGYEYLDILLRSSCYGYSYSDSVVCGKCPHSRVV